MKVELIMPERFISNPKNEAEWLANRTHDITSTEIGALFGIDSATYIPSLFELWHRKKNKFSVEFEDNERVKWGKRLETSIANGVAEDNGWTIRPMTEYIRLPKERIGASFDFSIDGYGERVNGKIPTTDKKGLLEIKNVDSLQLKQKWIIEDDNIEAPLHIELQVQHQLLVSGRAFAYIAALVGGNRVVLIRREADAKVHEAIKDKAKAFWESVEKNEPPAPDFRRDSDFISHLYSYSQPGKVIESSDTPGLQELVNRYRAVQAIESEAKKDKEALKAEILTIINDAEKVVGDGWSISSGLIGPTWIEAYERKGYRNFKINAKRSHNVAS